MATITTLITLI